MYQDLFNVDSALGHKGLFLINPHSVALVSKTRYDQRPQEIRGTVGQTRYRIPSNTLKGVWYDVIYTVACESNDIKHKFKLIARFDMQITSTFQLQKNAAMVQMVRKHKEMVEIKNTPSPNLKMTISTWTRCWKYPMIHQCPLLIKPAQRLS